MSDTLQAKGYPDLASRRFLCGLVERSPHLPVFALVDLDPDGIAIMSTYKFGSYRLAHEGLAMKDTPGLALLNLRWLGVTSSHISRFPTGTSSTAPNGIAKLRGLMKLTARDRAKASRMLEWDMCAEEGLEQGWREELQRMLMLNIKAEMQILDELPGGIVQWIRNELDKALRPSCRPPNTSTGSDDGMLF